MNPRLVTRLTAPLVVVSLLLLVIACGAAWYVRNLQQTVAGPITTSVASVRAAQELEISIRELISQLNRYLITGDRKHLDLLPRMKRRTEEALADADAAATTPAEKALMRRTREGYDHFSAEYEKVLREPPAQGLYLKIVELTDTVLTKELLDPAHEYLRLNEGVLTQASGANQELADRLTVGLVGLGVCGSVGGMLGGWVIAAAVRRSMLRTEGWLRDTAALLDRAARAEADGAAGRLTPTDALERATVSVSAVIRRLRETERDALRAEQLAWVGQMAAGIAHEVRNPLMAIKLLVQAAADRPDGAAFRSRDLQVLEEEIVRLEQIVSGFLDFARPPRPDARPVDVTALVAQTVDGVRARADLQGVTIDVRTPAGPLVASVDPTQLRQVVYNLLFNALDAQPQGGRIQVSLDAPAAPHGVAEFVLQVDDAGPGLPPDLGDRIFEPFVSNKESGMGLGLSICRRIVESHGGTLRAGGRPTGRGAVFTVRLPLTHPSPPAAVPSESVPPPALR
jgi:signal transduction histidine kinase